MSTSVLSSRAIVGKFYERYENVPTELVNQLAMTFNSDQASETYKWLGMVPKMREWVGGRQAKSLRDDGFTIYNKKYENTIEIPIDDLERDKTGQIMVRVNEMADAAGELPLDLMVNLLNNAESGVCYDGQYFFDTDHVTGDSGVQDNDLSINISALPVDVHGSTTAPSVQEMVQVILKCIQQIYSFKDDQGRPINRNCRHFVVTLPIPLWSAGLAAATLSALDRGTDNLLVKGGFKVDVIAEPLLTWTTKVAVFAVDGSTKPFIRQIEKKMKLSVKDENSEYAHDTDNIQIGTKVKEGLGYGMWYRACMATMT